MLKMVLHWLFSTCTLHLYFLSVIIVILLTTAFFCREEVCFRVSRQKHHYLDLETGGYFKIYVSVTFTHQCRFMHPLHCVLLHILFLSCSFLQSQWLYPVRCLQPCHSPTCLLLFWWLRWVFEPLLYFNMSCLLFYKPKNIFPHGALEIRVPYFIFSGLWSPEQKSVNKHKVSSKITCCG